MTHSIYLFPSLCCLALPFPCNFVTNDFDDFVKQSNGQLNEKIRHKYPIKIIGQNMYRYTISSVTIPSGGKSF